MPQTQPQQQQSNKKNKYATRKTLTAESKEFYVVAGGCDGGGAGDSAVAAVKARMHEKKPLHASMEQLKVGLCLNPQAEQKPHANKSVDGGNWPQVTQCNNTNAIESATEANEENKIPPATIDGTGPERTLSKAARVRQRRKAAQRNKYVAMDCEMVGVGCNGQGDMLARVSVVNKQGEVLLDKFVKPRETVTDYRTSISGIRPRDIEHAEDFDAVQDEVVELLQGKILVGHAIRNDLAVLHIKHPYVNIRDTSRYKPLCRLVANGRTPSLKRLTQSILGLEIQTGEHNSVEDARAAMNIYNRLSSDWEQYIQKQQNNQHQHHNHYHHQRHHKHDGK